MSRAPPRRGRRRAGLRGLSVDSERRLGKALLVEDDTLVAMLVEDHLAGIGFEPVWVETAADALAALGGGGLALAVIDVGLPDMRGDALAAQARRICPGLPIVVATGYDGAEIGLRFSGDPATAILGKPYTERELRHAITSLGLDGVEAEAGPSEARSPGAIGPRISP